MAFSDHTELIALAVTVALIAIITFISFKCWKKMCNVSDQEDVPSVSFAVHNAQPDAHPEKKVQLIRI